MLEKLFEIAATKLGNAVTLYPVCSAEPIRHPNTSGDDTVTAGRVVVSTVENGTIKTNVGAAKAGQTVTVTVTPDADYYVVTGVSAKSDTGATVIAAKKDDGTYEFTMPEGAEVTVSATIAHLFDLFTDVPAGEFYTENVKWAVEKGITKGTSDTTFSPLNNCTRKEMVLFLYRANNKPLVSGSNNFTDILGSDYDAYRDAIQWAVENGITKGTSATTFNPEGKCTRAEMVTFLHRMFDEAEATGTNSFVDVPADAYYKTAVQWAVNEGITYGTSATTFNPNGNCSRGEMVTFLYRALDDAE